MDVLKKGTENHEKLKAIREVFYRQPSRVIQWTPYKTHYSWGLIGPSDGEKIAKEILDILLNESSLSKGERIQ